MRLKISGNGDQDTGHPEATHSRSGRYPSALVRGFTAVGFSPKQRLFLLLSTTKMVFHFGHYTYVIAGDGDFMEGVSAEAASGSSSLDKLIVLTTPTISAWMVRPKILSLKMFARYDAYGYIQFW